VLVCDLVVLELVRVAQDEARALDIAGRLDAFASCLCWVPRGDEPARSNSQLASAGVHRRVPPADLLIAAAAEHAGVELLHYDRDYERIAGVTALRARWFVPDGALA